MGLSQPVGAAVDEAVSLIEGLIARFLNEDADRPRHATLNRRLRHGCDRNDPER